MVITTENVEKLFEDHRLKIYRRFTEYILQYYKEHSTMLYAALKKEGLLDVTVEQQLKVPGKTEHEKTEIILKNIEDNDINAFLKFCLVLAMKEISMAYIVTDVLGLKLDDICRQLDGLSVDNTQAPASASAGASRVPGAPAPTARVQPQAAGGGEDPFILGHIQPVSEEEARSKLSDLTINSMDVGRTWSQLGDLLLFVKTLCHRELDRTRAIIVGVYQMKHKPRGRAVIINIEKYESSSKNRAGSSTHAENLNLLFTKLDIQVNSLTDPKAREIREYIDQERSSDDHGDAFVLCVLGHGNEGCIEATDGEYLRIEEDLVMPFNRSKAKALINRPKMFFIQACWGDCTTKGVSSDAQSEDLMGEQTEDGSQGPNVMTHEMADILVVNSTVEGYSSTRNTKLGSFFIRELVSVFSERCHKDHVYEMVTEVTWRMNNKDSKIGGFKQICSMDGKLTKKLYFLPGYSES